MGTIQLTPCTNMDTQLFSLFLLSLLCSGIFALQANPCAQMSVGDCTRDDENVIQTLPLPLELCWTTCNRADNCHFWRHDLINNQHECQLLKTDYHQDCFSFAGPVTGSIEDCMGVDQATCDALIPEHCTFDGDHLSDFELAPGSLSSVEDCYGYANDLHDFGVKFFAFIAETEDCQLFSKMNSVCTAYGGPATSPDPVNECKLPA